MLGRILTLGLVLSALNACVTMIPAIEPESLESGNKSGFILVYDLDMGVANGTACEMGLTSDQHGSLNVQLTAGQNLVGAFELQPGNYHLYSFRCYGGGTAYARENFSVDFEVSPNQVSFLGRVGVSYKDHVYSFRFNEGKRANLPVLQKLAQQGRLRSGFVNTRVEPEMLKPSGGLIKVDSLKSTKAYNEVVNSLPKKLQSCYSDEAFRTKLLLGTARYRIELKDGKFVKLVRLPSSTLISKEFDECAKKLLERVAFPKTSKDEFTLEVS
jgi:hypothetical protein